MMNTGLSMLGKHRIEWKLSIISSLLVPIRGWGWGVCWVSEEEVIGKLRWVYKDQPDGWSSHFGGFRSAKGGMRKTEVKYYTKISRAREVGVGCRGLSTALLLLCDLLEACQHNYSSFSPGPRIFKSQGWHYLGSNWGKKQFVFPVVLLKNYWVGFIITLGLHPKEPCVL